VAELGLGASVVQARTLDREELANVTGAVVGLNLACGVLVVLIAPLAAAVFGEWRLTAVIRVSAMQFLFYAVATVPQSLAQRDMKFKWLAIIDVWSSLLTSAITLVLAVLGYGVWALVFGNLAGAALRAALLLKHGGTGRPRFKVGNIGRHVRFGGAVTLSRVLWQFVHQSDVLIAGRFLTSEAVGWYSVSVHLATLPMQKTMSVLNQVAFVAVARLQDELPRLRVRILDASRLMSLVVVPLLWGLSAVAPEFVNVVLGSRWVPAAFALQIVTIIVPLRMLAAVLSTSIAGLGRADLDLLNTLSGALVLPAAFLGGIRWGIDGLALSWVVAIPVIFGINFQRTSRVIGFTLRDLVAAVHAPFVAGTAMYLAVALARLVLHDTVAPYRLAVLVPIGAAVYLLSVLALDHRIAPEFRRVMSALRT